MNAKIFLLPYIENSMRGCPLVYSRYGGHTLRAERDFKIRFNNNISKKFVISLSQDRNPYAFALKSSR